MSCRPIYDKRQSRRNYTGYTDKESVNWINNNTLARKFYIDSLAHCISSARGKKLIEQEQRK